MPGWGQAVEDFDDIFVSAEYEDKAAEGGQYESDDLIAGQPGGEESEGEEECAKLTPEMIKFAKQHFTREEALLTKVGYPDVKIHAAHHQNLDHKMETILELAAMADQ